MNRKITLMLLKISILALVVSACGSQPVAGNVPESSEDVLLTSGAQSVDLPVSKQPGGQPEAGGVSEAPAGSLQSSGAQGVDLSAGGQLEAQPALVGDLKPSNSPEGYIDQGISEGSSQTAQTGAPVEDSIHEGDPQDILSPEERDAMLEGVNLSPPIDTGASVIAGSGPAPGTESILATETENDQTVEDSQYSAEVGAPVEDEVHEGETQSDLSPQERDAMLEGVNLSPPLEPDASVIAGSGPAPGTESNLAGEEIQDDTLDDVNRGPNLSEGDVVANDSFLSRLITALESWLRSIFTQ